MSKSFDEELRELGILPVVEFEETYTLSKEDIKAIKRLIRKHRPEKKPEYVKQNVGRVLFDVPAHYYSQALDDYDKALGL